MSPIAHAVHLLFMMPACFLAGFTIALSVREDPDEPVSPEMMDLVWICFAAVVAAGLSHLLRRKDRYTASVYLVGGLLWLAFGFLVHQLALDRRQWWAVTGIAVVVRGLAPLVIRRLEPGGSSQTAGPARSR